MKPRHTPHDYRQASNVTPINASHAALDHARALLAAAATGPDSAEMAHHERLNRIEFEHQQFHAALDAIAKLQLGISISDSQALAAIRKFAANILKGTTCEEGAP